MEFNEPASTGLTEGNTGKNTKATQDSKAQSICLNGNAQKIDWEIRGGNENVQKLSRG